MKWRASWTNSIYKCTYVTIWQQHCYNLQLQCSPFWQNYHKISKKKSLEEKTQQAKVPLCAHHHGVHHCVIVNLPRVRWDVLTNLPHCLSMDIIRYVNIQIELEEFGAAQNIIPQSMCASIWPSFLPSALEFKIVTSSSQEQNIIA
jgi:hypothetical protein